MGLPSGNFWHELPGRLRVTFQGQYEVNESDWGSGAWSLVLRCYVGDGAGRLTAMLGPACVIELDYPGAYADVPVGMEYVTHSFGGAGSVAWRKLAITCRLEPYVEV
jgi:hypothetical protein